jgi:hypothetical protein
MSSGVAGFHDLPVILVVGAKMPTVGGHSITLPTNAWKIRPRILFAARGASTVNSLVRQYDPDCIVSVARDVSIFPELGLLPQWLRERWIHLPYDEAELDQQPDEWWDDLAEQVEETMFSQWLGTRRSARTPMVSIFTPTAHGGDRLWRVFYSLRNQTYDNWEWMVTVDDPRDTDSIRVLNVMASLDARVEFWIPDRESGRIGHRKRQAAMLCNGEILVEMDHDDALLPHALDGVVHSFAMHDAVGFVYTDFSEPVYGTNLTEFGNYGPTFNMHFYATEYGQQYLATRTRTLTERHLYHLASLPNHIRAWNATVYRTMGGHKRGLIVADDYEMLLRTFDTTRSMYYDRLAYLQYRNKPSTEQRESGELGATGIWDNFTFRRNKLIQWIVSGVYRRYWDLIHERAEELGPGPLEYRYGHTDARQHVTVVLTSVPSNVTLASLLTQAEVDDRWTLLILTTSTPCPPWLFEPEPEDEVVSRHGQLYRGPSRNIFVTRPGSPVNGTCYLLPPATYATDRAARTDRGLQLAASELTMVVHPDVAEPVYSPTFLRDALGSLTTSSHTSLPQALGSEGAEERVAGPEVMMYSAFDACPPDMGDVAAATTVFLRTLFFSSSFRSALMREATEGLLASVVGTGVVHRVTECPLLSHLPAASAVEVGREAGANDSHPVDSGAGATTRQPRDDPDPLPPSCPECPSCTASPERTGPCPNVAPDGVVQASFADPVYCTMVVSIAANVLFLLFQCWQRGLGRGRTSGTGDGVLPWTAHARGHAKVV